MAQVGPATHWMTRYELLQIAPARSDLYAIFVGDDALEICEVHFCGVAKTWEYETASKRSKNESMTVVSLCLDEGYLQICEEMSNFSGIALYGRTVHQADGNLNPKFRDDFTKFCHQFDWERAVILMKCNELEGVAQADLVSPEESENALH